MKSKKILLLENSLQAATAAVEIYNKPKFQYREEIFSILMINAWELCLKAKYLKDHRNRISVLYVPYEKMRKDGKKYKVQRYKTNRAGNYITLDIKNLLEKVNIDKTLKEHLNSLIEIRDNAVHFLNNPVVFQKTFLEIAIASIRGYETFLEEEFNFSLKKSNFSIIPISFDMSKIIKPASLSKESPEMRKLLAFLINTRKNTSISNKYDVALNIDVKFSRSQEGALSVKYDKEGIPIFQESEDAFISKYPLSYNDLTNKLKNRYTDFKINRKFYDIKSTLEKNDKFSKPRFLDINNPKSSRKIYYSTEIIKEFDKHYKKK